jgi:hypothetical protein
MGTEILIALGGFVAVSGYFVLRPRPRPEEPVYRSRCPHCAQKLRYPVDRAGHVGMCPRCGCRWILPLTPPAPVLPAGEVGYRIRRR